MAGSSERFDQFERLAALPPYVLATVDELKSRLRAEGHDVYDFGLGNPDGPSPRAVIERLVTEAQRPGNQRYMPSRGLPEVRAAICDWYARRYGESFDPDGEAVITLGAKEGLAHLLLAIVGRGDCVLQPDPCYPIHRFGVIIAGGQPVPVATGPGRDAYAEIEAALARSLKLYNKKPKGLIVNYPHNPTSAVVDLAFFEKVVALAKRESLWVISDLAYADLVHDGKPAPSIFQVEGARDVAVEFFTVSKSYSMPGWRVGFCVGNRTLVGALTTIKGYLDYGIFGPAQLAAATALGSCDAEAAANRVLYTKRAALLCAELAANGWPVPKPVASMFVWAPLPPAHAALGSVRFASELLERARVAVSPGVGFGPGGEGFVRFALIESDDRVRQACAAIGAYLGSARGNSTRVDKAAQLK
jgi:alanine-synthesizing transaminase